MHISVYRSADITSERAFDSICCYL